MRKHYVIGAAVSALAVVGVVALNLSSPDSPIRPDPKLIPV